MRLPFQMLAMVRTPQARYHHARIFIDANSRAVVWAAVDGGRTKVADAQLASFEQTSGTRTLWTATTESGETWEVRRSNGCGCRSPLRKLTEEEAFA